ncbi:MAG TPA: hypothetical protein VFE98_07445 [Candidatus Bathyarchaeia archaeon]|nr:hypothetical protein [Candidatus Bathyarchaeia archaeon]
MKTAILDSAVPIPLSFLEISDELDNILKSQMEKVGQPVFDIHTYQGVKQS